MLSRHWSRALMASPGGQSLWQALASANAPGALQAGAHHRPPQLPAGPAARVSAPLPRSRPQRAHSPRRSPPPAGLARSPGAAARLGPRPLHAQPVGPPSAIGRAPTSAMRAAGARAGAGAGGGGQWRWAGRGGGVGGSCRGAGLETGREGRRARGRGLCHRPPGTLPPQESTHAANILDVLCTIMYNKLQINYIYY